ncbi:MAG TPA: hypothetical protein VJR89_35740, partial [Polyangiales bacterium]|nr:hypothetical protein [Polyangiales bacterium]
QLWSLVIDSNYGLTSLDGLQGITRVTDTLIVWGGQLQNFSGLSGLTSVGTLEIAQQQAATSLSSLEGLNAVTWSLNVHHNPKLTSLAGLRPAALTNLS